MPSARPRAISSTIVTPSGCALVRRCDSSGWPIQNPALRGRKRCRLHDGAAPETPRGAQNGNYKDGEGTTEAVEERRWLRSLARAFAQRSTNRETHAESDHHLRFSRHAR